MKIHFVFCRNFDHTRLETGMFLVAELSRRARSKAVYVGRAWAFWDEGRARQMLITGLKLYKVTEKRLTEALCEVEEL